MTLNKLFLLNSMGHYGLKQHIGYHIKIKVQRLKANEHVCMCLMNC